jgi:LDH2 family malate/lactate/ureidoglycolate dehydrogenase
METVFKYDDLYRFTYAVFKYMGCDHEHAVTATTVLLSADVRGIDSHGIARLSGYVRLWEAGRINSVPKIQVTHETPINCGGGRRRGPGIGRCTVCNAHCHGESR